LAWLCDQEKICEEEFALIREQTKKLEGEEKRIEVRKTWVDMDTGICIT
jgi:hypothetical protein